MVILVTNYGEGGALQNGSCEKGRGTKSCHPLKGGSPKLYPVLRGGGGAQKVAPTPLPVINYQFLIDCILNKIERTVK